jgi:hypothetical protein
MAPLSRTARPRFGWTSTPALHNPLYGFTAMRERVLKMKIVCRVDLPEPGPCRAQKKPSVPRGGSWFLGRRQSVLEFADLAEGMARRSYVGV